MRKPREPRTDSQTAYIAMSFRLSPETKTMLNEMAIKKGVSNSSMLVDLIAEKHNRLFGLSK